MKCSFCLVPISEMPEEVRVLSLDGVNICSCCLKECNKLLKKDTEDKVITYNFEASYKINIFYLDSTPELCARYHCDKHVVTMILKTAQIISTVINTYVGFEQEGLYKSTHKNHPCVLWAGKTYANFTYLLDLLFYLNFEYKYRWNKQKDHASYSLIKNYMPDKKAIPLISTDFSFTPPALAMPDYCKVENDPVASYRNYYNQEKKHIHKWTNREIPEWIV